MNIQRKVKVHFVGVGGIGMSGIAEVLLSMGYSVSGSDISGSASLEKLKSLGAQIYVGHDADNVKDCTVIVYSSAIKESNPEIVYAKANRIPLMRRAEMLAELMRLKHGIAVAGTHGKTTTTSILATILEESAYNPTYIIGGVVNNLRGHAKVGKGDFLVAEADESDGTFLLLSPIMSVITNVDNDHMEFYKTHEKLVEAFENFVNKVPFYGVCSLNAHDPVLMDIKSRMKKPWITYGISDEGISANFEAKNVVYSDKGTTFDLYIEGEFKSEVSTKIFGRHNVLNALGAISIASFMKVPLEKITQGISKFEGVGRRFQKLYEKDNVLIIDDYGHHPTEVFATISTAKTSYANKKLIVVFEPHRFSRTKDCWDQFLHCFNGADELHLAPIYAASEEPVMGITSERLGDDINRLHPNFCTTLSSVKALSTIVEKHKKDNILLLTLGAGSIGKAVRDYVETL